MSPLHVQIQTPNGTWIDVGKPLEPGENPGSISNNPRGGERELYVFSCENEHSSVIYRTESTLDVAIGEKRIMKSSVLDEVARLEKGSSPYEVGVRTDLGVEAKVRFIHKER